MVELEQLFSRTLNKEYQALNFVISTGRSKELLGRNVTIKELDEMSTEQIEVYHKIYELNYSEKVSSSLNGAIISLYSYAINKVVPIDDVEKLQADLIDSYILKHELKNITGGLARVGGKLWALAELGLTTTKHIKIWPSQKQAESIELCKDVVDSELGLM